MRTIILNTLALFFLASQIMAVHPRDMKFSPLEFEPPEAEKFVTENGLIVYFLEDHQLPILTLNAYFHGGAVHDPEDKAGLGGITATLLRSGGAGDRMPDQVDMDLDFVGASISSSADDDYLSLSMRVLKKDIELGFEILSDMLIKPSFDSSKFALEISNRKDRIRRQNDDPHDVSRRVYYQTVYTGHPYGVYPTLVSVDNINRSDVAAQHKHFYNPDNCIMAVSGDIKPEELKNIIEKYFGGWKKAGIKIESPPPAETRYKPGVYYAEKDINQANIRFGHLCMTDKNPDRFPMDVMNFALGGGDFSSRLVKQVRTTAGLAYSTGTYLYNRPLMGTLFGYCQTKADQLSAALEMMIDIIGEVRENGITAEEMELAKESIINSYVFNYDTPAKLVNARALLELQGFPADQLTRDIEAYQAVTLEKCNEVAGYYLNTDNIVIVITGNEKLFDKPLETFGPVTKVSMEIK